MRRRASERWVAAVVLAAAAVAFTLAFTVGHRAQPVASAAHVTAPSGCAARLIRDWRDGRIDGTYPITCYRQAAKSLPTDLQVYSSAPDDIRQALARRVAERGLRRPAG